MAQKHSHDEVMAFLNDVLVRKYGIDPRKIVADARIREDLKIDGDDAVELFDLFHDQFPFDATHFRYDDFFGPEGLSLGILGRFFGRRQKPTCPMTITMLIESAVSGHWKKK